MAWSDAARAAALEARRTHMKGGFVKVPKAVHDRLLNLQRVGAYQAPLGPYGSPQWVKKGVFVQASHYGRGFSQKYSHPSLGYLSTAQIRAGEKRTDYYVRRAKK